MSEACDGLHDDSEPVDSVHQEVEEEAGENGSTGHANPKTANTKVVNTRQEQCKRDSYEPKCGERDNESVELDPCSSQRANCWLLETLNHKINQHERPGLVQDLDDLLICCKHMYNRISGE